MRCLGGEKFVHKLIIPRNIIEKILFNSLGLRTVEDCLEDC